MLYINYLPKSLGNYFLYGVSVKLLFELRFNSCAHTHRFPWIPAAWMALPLKMPQKASLVFVDPNMMCISDHVSKVPIEAIMLGFSGVLWLEDYVLFVSDETSPLINTRSTTFDGTRFNLHAGSFSKQGVTDEARQSWGGGENSCLFHWVINFVRNKTMHPVAVLLEHTGPSVIEPGWGIVVESV